VAVCKNGKWWSNVVRNGKWLSKWVWNLKWQYAKMGSGGQSGCEI
jgi:hypothetical protein